MRKTLIIATVIMLAFSASAVVGGPEPEDGEMAITSSGSSASATTAVGPNGTEWKSSVKMRGRSPNISEAGEVSNISLSDGKVSFSGKIQAPTPCHVLDTETSETEDQSYSINIQTVKEDLDNGTRLCTQQVVVINYEGSFEKEKPYNLTISHDGEAIEEISNRDNPVEEPEPDRQEGFLNSIVKLFRGLF